MKKILIVIILFAGMQHSWAQNISNKVISSAGGTMTGGSKMITYTIGETVIYTLSSGNNMLTQGFQQPGAANVACNITLSGVITTPSCYGSGNGSIHVSSSNAAGTASYMWNNGNTSEDRSGLTAGTYTVTVTYGAGCFQTQSFVVNQPGTLSINGNSINIDCRGAGNGSITLAPTGGISPYSYHWNNGSTAQNRSSLTPGTYVVTVNDAHLCGAVIQSFVITQPATNMAINSSKTNIRCNGVPVGAASVSPTGGTAPYSYSWNTFPVNTTASISGLAFGSYTCTVTDYNGCTKNITIGISEPPPFVIIQTQTNVTFPGGNNGSASVAVSGGTPGYAYSWNTVPVKTTATITGLTAGVYKCTVTDSKSCPAKVSFTITQPVAKENTLVPGGSKQDIIIFPNPSNGIVSVKIIGLTTNNNVEFSFADITGRIVYHEQILWSPDDERVFDFSVFAKGVYTISCKTKETKVMQKIILQ